MLKSEQSMKDLLYQLNSNLRINLTGSYRVNTPDDWKITPQINDNQHILFVKAGYGKYVFEDYEFPLEPGSLIYVSSGCKHFAVHDPSNPLVIHGLRFSLVDHDLVDQRPIPPFSFGFKTRDMTAINKAMSEIDFALYRHNSIEKQLTCNALTSYIMSEIYGQALSDQALNPSHHKVDLVRRFMMETLSENTSVEVMANMVGMSTRHLRTCFKKRYGVSPKQYQLQLRMDYAKFLLETTTMTVKAISIALNYSDPYVFSKQFKHLCGFSPSQMKN